MTVYLIKPALLLRSRLFLWDSYPNVTLTYDNNGNITGKATINGTYSYLYDDENRLTEVRFNGASLASYTYDPFGRRIEKHVVSPAITYKYLYDGANILYEYFMSTTNPVP